MPDVTSIVFVVDDEISVRESLELLITSAGWRPRNFRVYPASYKAANLVAVAATGNRYALASFSNFGANSVDLGAPESSVSGRFGC